MSSSEENGAPETINIKTAKSQSKKQSKELEERQKLAARLKKEKNQARDVRLKAESAGKKKVAGTQSKSREEDGRKQKGKAKEKDLGVKEERTRLEERMEKAMAAAAEEDESGDTGDEDSDILMHEDDASSTAEDESDGGVAEVSLNPDYLPEHYFDQLGSSSSAPSTLKKVTAPLVKRKRKATDRRKREEKVIGSTKIRKLSSSLLSAVGRSTPSTNAKRFLRRQLKGDIKTKGWERRPAAIGSLASRTRPAAKFVRD